MEQEGWGGRSYAVFIQNHFNDWKRIYYLKIFTCLQFNVIHYFAEVQYEIYNEIESVAFFSDFFLVCKFSV